MKKIVLFCVMLSYITFGYAQITSDSVFCNRIYITQSKMKQDALFIRALQWCTESNTLFIKNITTQDKESGTILGNILFSLPESYMVNGYLKETIKANIKIDCRDNKYRISLSNFTYSSKPNIPGSPTDLSTETLELAKSQFEIISNLSRSQFNNSITWNIEKMPVLYKYYNDKLIEYQSELSKLQQAEKKKKKDIELATYEVDEYKKYMDFIGNIINGTNKQVELIKSDIDKKINISDDF